MPDGRTPEQAISTLLTRNRELEVYYRAVTLGNTRIPDGLDGASQSLYADIRDNYSPEKTASCKPASEIASIEDLTKKIMDRIGQM